MVRFECGLAQSSLWNNLLTGAGLAYGARGVLAKRAEVVFLLDLDGREEYLIAQFAGQSAKD